MKTKPLNPYQRLVAEIRQWAFDIKYRHRRTMFTYPKVGKGDQTGYRLDALHQRVAAADQLGYDVMLTTTDEDLIVQYVKKLPDAPWSVRPD